MASPGFGRCSSECQNTTAAHSPSTSASGSSRRSSRVGFRSSPVASRPRARSASIRVPSPAPTSSTGPAGAISSIRAACRPRVRPRMVSAREVEATLRVGPVPVTVGRRQLLVGGRRVRGGRRRTPRSACAGAGARTARRRGRRTRCRRSRGGPVAGRSRLGSLADRAHVERLEQIGVAQLEVADLDGLGSRVGLVAVRGAARRRRATAWRGSGTYRRRRSGSLARRRSSLARSSLTISM